MAGMIVRSLALAALSLAPALALDLKNGVIVAPPGLVGPEKKIAPMLAEEIEKRTRLRLRTVDRAPAGTPAIVIRGNTTIAAVPGADGYRVQVSGNEVRLAGNDPRGTLFAAGALLRNLHMDRDALSVADDFKFASAPKYPLRGHQLGYRPKTNSYDAWTVAMWEQYMRDLVVFGTNAIELIPPRSDDDRDSPHFPLPPMEMMIEMSRLADEYGLDVWIWYPAMDRDYSDPKTVEFALHEWGEVFRQLPRIDAVFVPGGDPGHTEPKYLMALLEKETALLHKTHPKGQMWVSPQSFNAAWMDQFLGILKTEPAWLSGVVFGPQVRMPLPQLRAAVPKRYPIRHYPDITHSRQSQYPVPDWDVAYAATEAREVINPRPIDETNIFRLLSPYTNGFLTYSEGCNDDVNKFVWSALGWNPDARPIDILREYSRYFIGAQFTESFAQGLLALERNWRGPLATNESVYTTLRQFEDMDRAASPQVLANWRFQQAQYRAHYDAYTRARLLYETELETRATDALRHARALGSLTAMQRADDTLDRAVAERAAPEWRARVFELAEALFQSIRMQLSVPWYKAISVDRGANLDTVDVPLNNRVWLKARFAEIRQTADENERLKAIDGLVNWTDPGLGGFYDDLGNLTAQPHLVRGAGYEKDPAHLESSLVGFSYRPTLRSSWWTHAEALVDAPLRMHYENLDPSAEYKLRVVYGGDSLNRKIRLVANGVEVHPLIAKVTPVRPVEFDVPKQATAKGELDLVWTGEPGLGGNGRGTQVSEVWLIRK
jgi:hypothetical protein